jgi:hypothetical protein
LTFAVFSNAQIVKIQGGTSISSLNWQDKVSSIYQMPAPSYYDDNLIGYSIYAGIDYLDKKYFNLSSNIGLIRKGGKRDIQRYNDHYNPSTGIDTQKPALDYLSINTTIDFKYPVRETIAPFISFGPRFDYLFSSSEHFDTFEEVGVLKKTSLGLILGGGVKYDVSKLQFGLRADYYLDFKKVADWSAEDFPGNGGQISAKTFTISLSIGYRLK